MVFQRILITGANGLLGQELVRQLSADVAYDVLATGLNSRPQQVADVSFGYVRMDICDVEAVRRIVEDFAPHCVVNCAAMTQVDRCEEERDQCWRVNARGVRNLARACRSVGSRLVQLSTDFVFDGTQGLYREIDRPSPINFYGKAKLGGENAAREAGMEKWTIVRTNVVYGLSGGTPRSDFVQWIQSCLEAEQSVQVFTDQWRTPTYTFDLAQGIESLVRYGKSGIYHLSGREYVSMYEFALAIADAFALDSTLVQPANAATLRQRAQRPSRTGLVILKAETEINYRPLSMSAALRHLYQRLNLRRTAQSES